MQNFFRRCWAEIDLSSLQDNFCLLQKAAKDAIVMPMVKANAYGHGAAETAKALAEVGATQFGVACLSEALRLRKSSITQPILIVGHTNPAYTSTLIKNQISQCVFNLENARQLSANAAKLCKTLTIHLKIDTGMGRLGFNAAQNYNMALSELCEVFTLPNLRVEGIFTHFAAADTSTKQDLAYTNQQFYVFEQIIQDLKQKGYSAPIMHCCNSGGLLAHPNKHLSLVRPGIALYGYHAGTCKLKNARPALRFCAEIAQVQTHAAGSCISYGCTYKTKKQTRVATITAGYADGYPRLLSNRGIVSIHGQAAPVLGRVCMDQLMVDVTHIPNVQAGDVAVLFGGDNGDSIESAAKKSQTINYEILCAIALRVPRIYYKDKQVHAVTEYKEIDEK